MARIEPRSANDYDVFGNQTCAGGHQPPQTTFSQTGDGFLYTGIYQERWRQPGSDVTLCFKGHISLSKIAV